MPYNCTLQNHTVCPRRLDPNYIETYYMKWVKTVYSSSKGNCLVSVSFKQKNRLLGASEFTANL